jgi:hypothetical protein
MNIDTYGTGLWRAARASWGGADYLLRTRESLPDPTVRSHWNKVEFVRWALSSSPSGMPEPAENERCLEFEATLESHVTRVGVGVLVAVVTGNGTKEWRFYTPSHDDFMRALNEALAGKPKFPIEISSFVDDQWLALTELLG